MQQWIPLTERKPEDGRKVWLHGPEDCDWSTWSSDHESDFSHFTHWLPRPDDPVEEAKGLTVEWVEGGNIQCDDCGGVTMTGLLVNARYGEPNGLDLCPTCARTLHHRIGEELGIVPQAGALNIIAGSSEPGNCPPSDRPAPDYKVWECKIVLAPDTTLPAGFDNPPRCAAIEAVEKAGFEVLECFSGWVGSLTDTERELVDERHARPTPDAGGWYRYPEQKPWKEGPWDVAATGFDRVVEAVWRPHWGLSGVTHFRPKHEMPKGGGS